MSINHYTANTLIRVKVEVDEVTNGSPIDPTTVQLKMNLPNGQIVDLSSSISNDSVGVYHADYLPALVGLYQYEWIGTGAAQVASIGSFLVDQAVF